MNFIKVTLPAIILIGFLLRIYFLFFQTDINHLRFYEYGAIAENMHQGYGYSLFYYNNDKLEIGFSEKVKPYESAFIPPGYVLVVYLFYYINAIETRNFLFLVFQIFISLTSIYFLFLLAKEVFSYTSAIITALIAAILPEFIYASCLPGTTIIFHLGIGIILILLFRLNKNSGSMKTLVLIGITFGIMILFRSELILFLLLICIYFVNNKQIKSATIILIVSVIFILPWSIRNFLVFNELVPLSTNFGVNFYRGHNPYTIGVWADQEIVNDLIKYKSDSDFELRMNEYYTKIAIENIVKNPLKELEYIYNKLFHLWIFNSKDERTDLLVYFGPWFTLIALFLVSLKSSYSWRNQKFLYMFLIYFNSVVIIFFCLPRYQTMMKFAIIPFAGEGLRILGIRIIERIRKQKI